MGYLNGINYSDFFGTTSFIVKIVSIVLAGVAGLCLGKSGTYAYLGAMIGMGILYLPISGFEFFHNDARKREFVSCGMACGIAAAFGSPIGGTLFGYEISQPNTFWEVQSTWRTFIACSITVVTYSLVYDIWIHGDISEWVLDSASLKFDTVIYPTPTFQSLPAALIIGSFCGILGVIFVSMNTYVHMFRKDFLSSPALRVTEVVVIAMVTSSFAYWLPYTANAICFPMGDNDQKILVQYNCPTDYFNPLATLFFNTEGSIIKSIVSGYTAELLSFDVLSSSVMGIFACFWFYFAVLTYGAAVPSGVFLSSILVGCSIGQIYENIRINVFGLENTTITSMPLILGAASMMSSTTRLSYSIVVLMLETSNSFNLAIPMIVAVFTSKTIADYFTNGLFDREIRDLQMPMLKGTCPPECKEKRAHEIMSKELITITSIAEMLSV